MTAALLTLPDFCSRYAISRSETYRQHNAGRLRFTKIGKATRIAVEDAEAWLAALREADTANG
ncbi:MAG: helix-turn-helix domain-containing protein [Sphingomonadaceae bacterium]